MVETGDGAGSDASAPADGVSKTRDRDVRGKAYRGASAPTDAATGDGAGLPASLSAVTERGLAVMRGHVASQPLTAIGIAALTGAMFSLVFGRR